MRRDDRKSEEMSEMPFGPMPLRRNVAIGHHDGGAKEKSIQENDSEEGAARERRCQGEVQPEDGWGDSDRRLVNVFHVAVVVIIVIVVAIADVF